MLMTGKPYLKSVQVTPIHPPDAALRAGENCKAVSNAKTVEASKALCRFAADIVSTAFAFSDGWSYK